MWNWLELCARYQPPRTCWGGHGHGCGGEGDEGGEGVEGRGMGWVIWFKQFGILQSMKCGGRKYQKYMNPLLPVNEWKQGGGE